MAYEDDGITAKIICDKCGADDYATSGEAGKAFFYLGWTANFGAKKYVHICYNCQTNRQKETTDWARNKF